MWLLTHVLPSRSSWGSSQLTEGTACKVLESPFLFAFELSSLCLSTSFFAVRFSTVVVWRLGSTLHVSIHLATSCGQTFLLWIPKRFSRDTVTVSTYESCSFIICNLDTRKRFSRTSGVWHFLLTWFLPNCLHFPIEVLQLPFICIYFWYLKKFGI